MLPLSLRTELKRSMFKCPKCSHKYLTFTETNFSKGTFYCTSCTGWFVAKQKPGPAGAAAADLAHVAALPAALPDSEGDEDEDEGARARGVGRHASEDEPGAPAAASVKTPRAIYEGLNEHVIGQHRVKMALAVGVHNHYTRVFAAKATAAEATAEVAEVAEAAEVGASPPGAPERNSAEDVGGPTGEAVGGAGATGVEEAAVMTSGMSLEEVRAAVRSKAQPVSPPPCTPPCGKAPCSCIPPRAVMLLLFSPRMAILRLSYIF